MTPTIDLTLLPENPGIYKMLNQSHEVLYIGKAKNLKKRISSYFKTSHNDVKTSVLVKHIYDVETMITKTEKEALILENQLIKSIKPRYNILLKDDKSYPYIKITSTEPFPKIIITRERKNDGGTYFGPYPSIGSTRKLRRLLYDLFPLRDCKQAITLTEQQPKCLLLDIEKCLGPCIFKNIQPIYYEHLDQLKKFLSGRNAHVIRNMTKKMKELSAEQKFSL